MNLDIINLKDSDLFKKTENILEIISNLIQNKSNLSQSFAIDRFEDNFAICENLKTKEIINIPNYKLPKNTKENDVITLKNTSFYIDNEKTALRKDYIENLTKNLFENKLPHP